MGKGIIAGLLFVALLIAGFVYWTADQKSRDNATGNGEKEGGISGAAPEQRVAQICSAMREYWRVLDSATRTGKMDDFKLSAKRLVEGADKMRFFTTAPNYQAFCDQLAADAQAVINLFDALHADGQLTSDRLRSDFRQPIDAIATSCTQCHKIYRAH